MLVFKSVPLCLFYVFSIVSCILQGGDVYSYDEDDMVIDTQLARHLQHFGIDMMQCQQTGLSLFYPSHQAPGTGLRTYCA